MAEDLYSSSQTNIEAEAELLAEASVCGHTIENKWNGDKYYGNTSYIKKSDFKELCLVLNLKSARSFNDYFKKLQDIGVIAYKESRSKDRRLGYEVQRNKEYYDPNLCAMNLPKLSVA